MNATGRVFFHAADDHGIARLTISHPGKLNALNVAMWHELRGHIEALGRSGPLPRVIVNHGEGGTFVAGFLHHGQAGFAAGGQRQLGHGKHAVEQGQKCDEQKVHGVYCAAPP